MKHIFSGLLLILSATSCTTDSLAYRRVAAILRGEPPATHTHTVEKEDREKISQKGVVHKVRRESEPVRIRPKPHTHTPS